MVYTDARRRGILRTRSPPFRFERRGASTPATVTARGRRAHVRRLRDRPLEGQRRRDPLSQERRRTASPAAARLPANARHVAQDRARSRVAHRMALDHPDRVEKAVMLDTVPVDTAFENVNADLATA